MGQVVLHVVGGDPFGISVLIDIYIYICLSAQHRDFMLFDFSNRNLHFIVIEHCVFLCERHAA